jgi:hypothetical protein
VPVSHPVHYFPALRDSSESLDCWFFALMQAANLRRVHVKVGLGRSRRDVAAGTALERQEECARYGNRSHAPPNIAHERSAHLGN